MNQRLKIIIGLGVFCVVALAAMAYAGVITPLQAAGALTLFAFGAVTTENSTQYGNNIATPTVVNPAYNEGGKIRFAYFSFTQGAAAGDANSLQNLAKLPPGKVRLLKTLSKLNCSAFGAARTLDIGYLAHTKQDGTAVNASQDTILDGADVSAAASVTCGAGTNALGADPTILFDSREGVVIQSKCLGDTIPAGATLAGFFAYVIE